MCSIVIARSMFFRPKQFPHLRGDCFAKNARNDISNGIIEHMTTEQNNSGRARPLDPESKPDDRVDNALRPEKLTDLIGQDQVKENLSILIDAARKSIPVKSQIIATELIMRGSTMSAPTAKSKLG